MSNYNDDDFMELGAKTVPFETIGDSVTGLVLSRPEKRQQQDENGPKTFNDGSPRYMYVVEILTELRDPQDPTDDGRRTLYLKWHSHRAVVTAVKASGARGLEPGGLITLTLIGFGPKTNPKHNPPKLYSASYTPPDPNVEFMGTDGSSAPAPTPVAVAPAAVAAPPAVPVAAGPTTAAGMEALAKLRAQQQAAVSKLPSHHSTGAAPF